MSYPPELSGFLRTSFARQTPAHAATKNHEQLRSFVYSKHEAFEAREYCESVACPLQTGSMIFSKKTSKRLITYLFLTVSICEVFSMIMKLTVGHTVPPIMMGPTVLLSRAKNKRSKTDHLDALNCITAQPSSHGMKKCHTITTEPFPLSPLKVPALTLWATKSKQNPRTNRTKKMLLITSPVFGSGDHRLRFPLFPARGRNCQGLCSCLGFFIN